MKIKLDTKDKISEATSVLFLLVSILMVVFSLPNLPDIVPNHFNLNGEPNKYGSKYFLWVGPAVALFMYVLLTVLAGFPQSYNFHYTKNNIEAQYKITSKMVRSIKAGMMMFFVALNFFLVQSAQLKFTHYIIVLVPMVLLIIFGNVIYYYIKWGKIA